MNMTHTAISITFHAMTGTICIMCEFETTSNSNNTPKAFDKYRFQVFFYSCIFVAALMICIVMQPLYPSAYGVILQIQYSIALK